MKRTLLFVGGIILVVIIALGAFISSGKAQSTPQSIREVCISDTTLRVQINSTICIDGDCNIYSKESDTICSSGQCDTVQNKCSPDPFTGQMLFIGFIVVVIIVFILLWRFS